MAGTIGKYQLSLLPERIIQKIIITDNCWICTACRNRRGYPLLYWDNNQRPAHRVVYMLLLGEDISGLHLHHECGNKLCVNPDHMRPMSIREHGKLHPNNAQSWYERARSRTHCTNGHELTPENTRIKIRKEGVSRICRICQRNYNRINKRNNLLNKRRLSSREQ